MKTQAPEVKKSLKATAAVKTKLEAANKVAAVEAQDSGAASASSCLQIFGGRHTKNSDSSGSCTDSSTTAATGGTTALVKEQATAVIGQVN